MLLIRPLLQTNRERRHVKHTVIFFIFLVSNIGGMLTPLGDPPLFLGYLAGVPFTWTLPALGAVGSDGRVLLLDVYFVWDSTQYAREPIGRAAAGPRASEPLRLRGASTSCGWRASCWPWRLLQAPAREIASSPSPLLSLWRTPRTIRRANGFTYAPIIEVAVLFLRHLPHDDPGARAPRLRGMTSWASASPGSSSGRPARLSSFLDNAPTYLTFLALAQGLRLAGRGRRGAARDPGRHQRGRGRHGREHLHRQCARTSWSSPSPRRPA